MKEIEVSGYEPFVEEIKDLIHKKQYQVLKLINAEGHKIKETMNEDNSFGRKYFL